MESQGEGTRQQIIGLVNAVDGWSVSDAAVVFFQDAKAQVGAA